MLQDVLSFLAALSPALIYLVIGVGAAIENVIPPIPADTFVLVGAFLAARGAADPWVVFFVTWLANVASALAVYGISARYGRHFFTMPIGHWLLREHQLQRIAIFYARWGLPAIFFSRFLPAFRAVVPVFAGLAHVPFWKVAPPVVAASGLWYGALVYIGAIAGRNLPAITRIFQDVSNVLLWIALALLAALGAWWWRTRRQHEDPEAAGEEKGEGTA